MVSGQLLAGVGRVASKKCIGNRCPGAILLRSESLFPPLLYFQSKKVTSVYVPHAWDARETQPIGGAPQ